MVKSWYSLQFQMVQHPSFTQCDEPLLLLLHENEDAHFTVEHSSWQASNSEFKINSQTGHPVGCNPTHQPQTPRSSNPTTINSGNVYLSSLHPLKPSTFALDVPKFNQLDIYDINLPVKFGKEPPCVFFCCYFCCTYKFISLNITVYMQSLCV